MKFKKNLFYIFIAIMLCNCSKNTDDNNTSSSKEKRTFYMGTTPWPADLTVEEVDKTYDFINNNCDIVAHHFDEGIPFEEAFSNTAMPNNLIDNVNFRLQKTATNKKIFLSVSALAVNRIAKAPYFSNAPTNVNTKNYWESLTFDDPKTITAYVNYVNWLIDKLHPIYVNYGVESNAMLWNTAEFAKYRTFLTQVYLRLKTDHPTLPLFVSFMVNESVQSLDYAHQLINYTDYIALSAYPYIDVSSSASGDTNPANFPTSYFYNYINIEQSKPLAFAETGYTAENLLIPNLNLNKQSNENYQNDYLEKVLKICQEKKAKFFIWFCPKDYNALITTFQNQGIYDQSTIDLLNLWKDTGLINENGIQRLAFKSWIIWMSLEKE